MSTVAIEGVDFSATANADWPALAAALKAQGKQFVIVYAVSDKAPTGRGITAAAYHAFVAAGLEVLFFWEGTAQWMFGGYAAGVAAAQNAQANLVAMGAPPAVSVIFAHDVDPQPSQWAAIDACLNGCASVIGWPRVGAYGGWLLIDYLAGGGTVKLLCQPLAWEYGRGLHPAATLYQYSYNAFIAGTNCDLVRATQPNYGQASLYVKGNPVSITPAPKPVPTTPAPAPKPVVNYPEGMDAGIAKQLFGSFKASNGITVAYSEGEELSALWLANGSYERITNVIFAKDPTVTRIYWVFEGTVFWRPNDNAPIRFMKAA